MNSNMMRSDTPAPANRATQIIRRVAEGLINEGYHLTCMIRSDAPAPAYEPLRDCRDVEAVVDWFFPTRSVRVSETENGFQHFQINGAVIHTRRSKASKYPDGTVTIDLDASPEYILTASQLLAGCLASAQQFVFDSAGIQS